MRPSYRSLAFLSLGLAACSGVPPDAPDVLSSQATPISLATATHWPSPTIPVCWLQDPSLTDPAKIALIHARRQVVKDAVTAAYEGSTVVRFTGWGECSTASAEGIRIGQLKELGRSGSSEVGRFDDASNVMLLELEPSNKSLSQIIGRCDQSEERALDCLRTFSVHEFGHAVGLHHEQDGESAVGHCSLGLFPARAEGDLFALPYDPDSIMNYCNPHLSGRSADGELSFFQNFLSAQDVVAINFLFGVAPLYHELVVSLEASVLPNHYVSLVGQELKVLPVDPVVVSDDARFVVEVGRDDIMAHVSLRSVARPDSYVRVLPSGAVVVMPDDFSDPAFSSQASFIMDPGPQARLDGGYRFRTVDGRRSLRVSSSRGIFASFNEVPGENPKEFGFRPRSTFAELALRVDPINVAPASGRYVGRVGDLVTTTTMAGNGDNVMWEIVPGLSDPLKVSVRVRREGLPPLFLAFATLDGPPVLRVDDGTWFGRTRATFVREATKLGSPIVRFKLAADPALLLRWRPDGSIFFSRTTALEAGVAVTFVQTARPQHAIDDDNCFYAGVMCDYWDQDSYGFYAAQCLARGGTPPRCPNFEPNVTP